MPVDRPRILRYTATCHRARIVVVVVLHMFVGRRGRREQISPALPSKLADTLEPADMDSGHGTSVRGSHHTSMACIASSRVSHTIDSIVQTAKSVQVYHTDEGAVSDKVHAFFYEGGERVAYTLQPDSGINLKFELALHSES
ncbi:hypothetical protein K402DRAFT_403106 [Aulographum hederae CBS 113979]|uniref:Uncharacterized protein n=1 Tax=Aulographum hederae CBS 113979 TaxID=1176131 RepID=A0A6G1H4A9_9PEZI|nr:hypothetical protein K402DRAFT_403106 [Aulographum hederae CBS 113979]